MKNPEYLRPEHPDQPVVLVAEDDVMVLNVVRITLEKSGCFVLTAETGEDALFLSRMYPGNIHLLLSDIRMPKMSGTELGKAVARERPDTRILLMSGEPGAATGRFALLSKPFTPQKLAELVKGLLPSIPKRM